MAGNKNLNSAARDKNDEFYTRLTDIEKELRYYKDHFKDKVVLCNCDDPFESNFFKYFVLNFNRLGLKKLIATCYAGSPISNRQLSVFDITGKGEPGANIPYKAVVNKVYDTTGDGGIDMLDVVQLFKIGENQLTALKGDGDFGSDECVELLKESDIVVTNPPFSKFRLYVDLLIENEKKFVIIGNKNALTYKEIFPLIKDNKIWLGIMSPSDFLTPEGKLSGKLGGLTRWFTNLDIKKRHEDIILIKKYNSEDYPKYDNYDAINVDRVKDIPCDYDGIMGVPITFLDKYNPDQFEILGSRRWSKSEELIKAHVSDDRDIAINDKKTLIDGKETYDRIFVKNKNPQPRKQ